MAVSYEMYTFNADRLVEALLPAVELADKTGYSALRHSALKLYEESAHLRMMLDEYGGWDRPSIETQITVDEPADPEDMTFWMLFFVLNQMTELNRHASRLFSMAQHLKWEKDDIHRINYGRRFKEFARHYLYKTNDVSDNAIPSYWNYIRPASFTGSPGWLSSEDIEAFHRRLDSVPQSDNELFQNSLNAIKETLASIHRQGKFIAIIVTA